MFANFDSAQDLYKHSSIILYSSLASFTENAEWYIALIIFFRH